MVIGMDSGPQGNVLAGHERKSVNGRKHHAFYGFILQANVARGVVGINDVGGLFD